MKNITTTPFSSIDPLTFSFISSFVFDWNIYLRYKRKTNFTPNRDIIQLSAVSYNLFPPPEVKYHSSSTKLALTRTICVLNDLLDCLIYQTGQADMPENRNTPACSSLDSGWWSVTAFPSCPGYSQRGCVVSPACDNLVLNKSLPGCGPSSLRRRRQRYTTTPRI